VVGAAALLVGLGGLVMGLPLVLPDTEGLVFVERHYFRPIALAIVTQVAALAVRHRLRGGADLWYSIGGPMALIVIAVFVHFNLKAWMPLVNPRLFDHELLQTDYLFSAVVDAFIGLRRGTAAAFSTIGVDLDFLYHGGFIAMFFIAFAAHAVVDSSIGIRRLVLGVSIVLVVGGMLYWIMPAKGPFVYRLGENNDATRAQDMMGASFDAFVSTRVPPAGYFPAPPAAMPSLHIAHATFLTVSAWRCARWLGILFAPLLVWFSIEAVASGWHYFIDLPAGSLLAFGALWASDRWLPPPNRGLVRPSRCAPEKTRPLT
jgi:hypothetical protein